MSKNNGANPTPPSGLTVNQLATMMGRLMMASLHGQTHGGQRDLYQEFGYKRTLQFRDFFERYKRGGIARRIITLPVQATWRKKPTLFDDASPERTTRFEKELDALDDRLQLFSRLARLDRMARIGRFGVLLIGASDSKGLKEPLERATDLLHLTPYTEGRVTVTQYDVNPASPRFNLPEIYRIHTGTVADAGGGQGRENRNASRGQSIDVHHSRVIHVAEEMDDDEVYGTPALDAVFNYLDDLDKVVGGSGESFWRAAVPGLVATLDADAKIEEDDKKQIVEQIDDFVHKLRRVLRIQGGDVKELAGSPADPRGSAEIALQLIAGTTGIPLRILIGSERGELASTQDVAAFANLVQDRQTKHAEPNILRPTIDRLVAIGVLSEPQGGTYEVEWPDPHTPSEDQQAGTWLKKAQAVRTAFGPFTENVMDGSIGAQFMEGLGFDVSELDFDELEPIGEDPDLPEDLGDA